MVSVTIIGTEEKLPRAGGAKTDLTGLLWLVAHGGTGLPNLYRLPVGGKAPPENPLHITLDGDASIPETPKGT